MAQINVKLSDAKKEKWEQAVDDSAKYQSVSHLVRMAVEDELSDDDQSQHATAQPAPVEPGKLNDIDDKISTVLERIDDVESIVTQISEGTAIGSNISSDLFQQLPTFEDREQAIIALGEADLPSDGHQDLIQDYGRRKDILDMYPPDLHSEIDEALEQLESAVAEVEQLDIYDDTHYFKTE